MNNFNVAKLLNLQIAKDLAEHGDEVYVNDPCTEFYTYPDVASNNLSPTVFTDTQITENKGLTLFLMTYNSTAGTYPLDRTKPMKPRRKV